MNPPLNPPPWPGELTPLFDRALTVGYASLTRSGSPVAVPLTPYVGPAGTLDVSTGLTYPAKAERARRNPKVCLLYADTVGSGLTDPPLAVVQGIATVRDADLQAGTDRYVRESEVKLPESTKGQPRLLLRRFVWYFARIWVEVTPMRILWWPDGDLDTEPKEWNAPEGTEAPASDPAPPGGKPSPWLKPPESWESNAEYAMKKLSHKDMTFVDGGGFPLCLPVREVTRRPGGFALSVPAGMDLPRSGPGCLTFHDHPEVFTGQENRTFIGVATPGEGGMVELEVDRGLAHWSLPGNRLRMAASFLSKGRRLAPRLVSESERRGQPVPKVRFPGEY